MKFKEGDLLFCKKSNIYNNKYVHKFGKYYYIDGITEENHTHNYIIIYIKSENSTTPNNYYGYYYLKGIINFKTALKNFNEYFCTITELRELKLKKINKGLNHD